MDAGAANEEESHVSPLLERELDLATLKGALTKAVEGTGSVLVVEGPAGIGKTTLLSEAAELGQRTGPLVRQARGGQMEREIPFGIARQLFDRLLVRASDSDRRLWLSGSAHQALIALGRSEQNPSPAAVDAFAPINGLYWLVANLSDSQPVLLIVDDAQWADKETLRFLDFLVRRLSDLPVLVLLGVRSGEPDEPNELKQIRLQAELIYPRPLSTDAVRELVTGALGRSPSEKFAAACAAASGGNPFLLTELLREIGSEDGQPDDATAAVVNEIAPPSVVHTVLVRLGRFGEEAIELAKAIAVLGGAPQLRHAAKLARIDEDRAAALCDRLRDAEILSRGLPIDFAHPLIRQAIYREQSEGERSASHRRAADILDTSAAAPRGIAPHLLACTPNGDPWVVDRLREAARQAIDEGAYDGAVTYLERALQEPPDDVVPDLYWLGRALIETDLFRAPEVLLDAATRTSDPARRVEALRFLVVARMYTGDIAAAVSSCTEALEAVGDRDRELSLGLEALRYFLHTGAHGRDSKLADRIEALASDVQAMTTGERMIRQALSLDRFFTCRSVEEVTELALPFPAPPWEIGEIPMPLPIATTKMLAWTGQLAEARAALASWMEVLRRTGRMLPISLGHGLLSEIERLGGNLRQAEAEARTAWEIAQAVGRFSALGWSALMNLAATLIARGDVDGFTQLTAGLDLSAGPPDIPVNPWPLEIRAYWHLAQGDLEDAVRDFLALGETLESLGLLNPSYPPWRQEAAESLAALGRTAEAEELLTVAEDRARMFGAPHTIGSVLRARALSQPRKRSIKTLNASVSAYETHGPPTELARSLIELGAALRRDGSRTGAREPLRRALELAVRCGAGGLERRARDELAAAGSRPRRIVRTGLASLTATELRIATLAAKGLNNNEIAERLFVTRRTVETHLTHVYAKLGIRGRRDLKTALSEPGAESL